MSNCIFRNLLRRNPSPVRVDSPFQWLLQLEAFSSAANPTPKSSSKIKNPSSFTAKYLKKNFEFPEEKLPLVCRRMKFSSKEKPDSVVVFLENQGFTKEEIHILVTKMPFILASDPHKTLLPKIEFFRFSRIPEDDLRKIFTSQPSIFWKSLHKHIIRCFKAMQIFDENVLRNLSNERLARLLNGGLKPPLLCNLEVLRDAGVPGSNILYLLENHFRGMFVDTDGLRRVVKEVKNLGLIPSDLDFAKAVGALELMTKPSWDKKMAVYMKWGLSNDEVVSAYASNPAIMIHSEHKIAAIMDLLVDKMGFDSSILLKRPGLLHLSFENRFLPRCAVYKNLLENGLIKNQSIFETFIMCAEELFINKVLQGYMKKYPGLLKLYRDELARSNK